MNIEFNIFKLKPESDTYKRWSKIQNMNKDINEDLNNCRRRKVRR